MIRFCYIWSILIKYAFLLLLLKLGLYKKPPKTFIKKFFEEAGGSFIKFGQLLALRVDVLPQDFSLEMLDLLDNVKPFPYEDVKERFIHELGTPPEKIFKDFQSVPFASASFGQVHAAKLDDDTIVAVKILRPGIEDEVKIDFIFITLIAAIAEMFYKVDAMPWSEFAQEFKIWTKDELDYHIEASHTERMLKTQPKNSNVIIPKIYPRLSTKRILVQQYIEGIPLSRVLRGLDDGRLTPEELLEMGIDITKTPRILVAEMMREYFYFGVFHADPHPGNILLLENDKIALIDFGILGNSVANQKVFIEFLEAGCNYDYKKAFYYLLNFAGGELRQLIESAFPANIDQDHVNNFMKILGERFADSVDSKIQKGREDLKVMKTDYTVLSLQVLKEAQSYKIKLPKEMVVFTRAITIIGFMAKKLDYEFKLTEEIKKFFKENDKNDFILSHNEDLKRISRDSAIEKLNNWLSFLVEKDPKMYHLVNKYLEKYNVASL